MTNSTSLVQSQFGVAAADYATSDVHARGESLGRIIELAAPQQSWRALDVATGAGHMAAALAPRVASIVASDITGPMLAEAAKLAASRNLTNMTTAKAEAGALPFPDESFDLVVCQFGIMFFPDKVQANAEARRVLRSGGKYIIVIWDRVDRNVATHVAGRAVAALFPSDVGAFYERIPFRYHDREAIRADLAAAGFDRIEIETVELKSRAASARDAAIGLVQGTPMRSEIEQRDPAMLRVATDAAAEALKAMEGPDGFEAPMSAHIVTATK